MAHASGRRSSDRTDGEVIDGAVAHSLSGVLAGLFGGAGATLVWELGIRPGRDRRGFARLLIAELLVNRRVVANELAARSTRPTNIPQNPWTLYTSVFQSSTARLAELPLRTSVLVYWCYRYFHRIESFGERFWTLSEKGRIGEPGWDELMRRVDENYEMALKNSLMAIDKTTPVLEHAALPPWSRRRRRLARTTRVQMDEIADFVGLPPLD